MSNHSSTARDEPPDDGAALLSIPDPPQVPVDLVVTRLFPWPTLGQTFLARFKERAATERSIFPDLKAGDVMVCAKGIAELAEALDIAYDTAQKYVALFKALGMLQRRKFMGRTAFIFSLGIYLPPKNLAANLDYLLQRSQSKKSRSKYHGLVKDVKQRCLVYGLIPQEFTLALRQLHSLVQPEEGLSRRKLEQRLAQAQHLVSTMIAQLQNLPELPGMRDDDAHRQASESTRQEATQQCKSEMPPLNLPNQTPSRGAELLKQGSESTRPGSPDRFAESSAAANLSDQVVEVDSRRSGHSESTRPAMLGRFAARHVVQNPPKPPAWVDSSLPDQSSESTQTTHPSRRTASSDAKNLPTQPALVDSQGLANVNVGNVITNNMNVNVEIVAAFLCKLFNEPASKQGIYSKLFREGCNQAEVIHAAAIYTLVHSHRDKTIENPAAVFIARCKAYHKTGIPDEAAELLAAYGALTYRQLLDALQRPAVASAPTRPGTSPPASSPPVTPASLPPLPRWGTIPRLIEVERGRSGMSRQEALQVVARAQGDRRTKLCRVDLERLANGTYAVLLDNTITTVPRQTYVYSLREWEARTATINDCFELFGVVPRQRRSWTDLLKERGKR